jgi:hypothetical protein
MKPNHFKEASTCEMCVYSDWRDHFYICVRHKFEIQDDEASNYCCDTFQRWIYKDKTQYVAICQDCNIKVLWEEAEFVLTEPNTTLCEECYAERQQ